MQPSIAYCRTAIQHTSYNNRSIGITTDKGPIIGTLLPNTRAPIYKMKAARSKKLQHFGLLAVLVSSVQLLLLFDGHHDSRSTFAAVSAFTVTTTTTTTKRAQKLRRLSSSAFVPFIALSSSTTSATFRQQRHLSLLPSDDNEGDDGVVELAADDDDEEASAAPARAAAPFLSQGEIDEDAMNVDFSDAKQTRVLIYTVLSLLPVLFLIPFMLSRELIPLDSLPPVDM